MLNLIPLLIISHQNSFLFYPPDPIPQEYTSCNPKSITRQLISHSASHATHIAHSNNHLRGDGNSVYNSTDGEYDTDCPTMRGVCRQEDGGDDWKCVCHDDFYNLNKSSTKPCYHTRYYKDCIIIMTFMLGWTSLTALSMGWYGLFTISLSILIWVIILLVLECCVYKRKHFTPQANHLDNQLDKRSQSDSEKYYRFICHLSFYTFIGVWSYTIFLTCYKPINHLGIPNA